MPQWKSFVWFPALIVVLLGVGFWICFAIAVSNQHVDLVGKWPSVSETGQRPPESYIFTLLLTVATYLILITVYFQFRLVKRYKKNWKCNVAALIVGVIVCFGAAIVAAFQRPTPPHYIGAGVAFLGLLIYSIIILYITWQLANSPSSQNSNYPQNIVYLRIGAVSMEIVSLGIMVVSYLLHLSSSQNDERYRNVAHIGEWLLIYSAIFFLGTMTYEMRRIHGARVKLKVIEDEETNQTPHSPRPTAKL